MPTHLVEPHGGTLQNLIVSDEQREKLQAESRDWPSWDLTSRQLCDLELLLNGGFSPLTGFMGRADYDKVCESMRLADGTLWPISRDPRRHGRAGGDLEARGHVGFA